MLPRVLLGVLAFAATTGAWLAGSQDERPDTSTAATKRKVTSERFVFEHPNLDFTGAALALDPSEGAALAWLASTETHDSVFACIFADGEWGEVLELTQPVEGGEVEERGARCPVRHPFGSSARTSSASWAAKRSASLRVRPQALG